MFGLIVPRESESIMLKGITTVRHGGQSRNLRDSIVKHEAENKIEIEEKLSKITPRDILPAARLHRVNFP